MTGPEVLSKVKALGWPLGQYFVHGSAVLAAHGIREARDVDLVVQPELFKRLQRSGWKRKWFFWGCWHRKCVEKDGIEAYSNAQLGKYRPTNERLLATAEVIDGIPFMALEELANFKRVLNRNDKDRGDVAAIHAYLKKSAK